MSDLIEVELSRIILQSKGEQQYIHLKVKDSQRSFPILIGFYEAAEIHRKISGEKMRRPMTHDLIGRILEVTGSVLEKMVISSLHEETYYATLHVSQGGEEKTVDCRPSDAVALAVQAKVPIFVAREVLDVVAPES